MELKEIQNLIKFVAKSGASEVKLEMGDIKITIKTGAHSDRHIVQHHPIDVQLPVQTPSVVHQEVQEISENIASPVAPEEDSKYITIKSPIIGTFYRKQSPDQPPFIEVGDSIVEGDVLCVIEAMKLFNEIESEVSGKIIKVLVDDSSPVEFDQPLFLVDPS